MGQEQSALDYLADTRSRLKQMIAEKNVIKERAKAKVYEYIRRRKFELARIEAHDWVQKESASDAYEILDKNCEKLAQELREMFSYSERTYTRQQTEFAGTLVWAASVFKNELPELSKLATILSDMFKDCRDGNWGVNAELLFYVEASNEPSLDAVMERMKEATVGMDEGDRAGARSGIESCINAYAAGTPFDLEPPSSSLARPSTATSMRSVCSTTRSTRPLSSRRTTTVVMPPPYQGKWLDCDDSSD